MRKPAQPLVRIYNAEEARDGWTSRHTVVEVTVEDMPFLVDSLGMVLTQAGLTIHLMVHPVLAVRRDRRGRLVELAEGDRTNGQFRRESWQHIQIDRIGDEQRCASWSRRSCARSATCRPQSPTGGRCVSAQSRSRRKSRANRRRPARAEVHEVKALLEWMADNHFTFLGYRQYRLRRGRSEDVLEPLPDTGLGILRVATRLVGRADGADRRAARACAPA